MKRVDIVQHRRWVGERRNGRIYAEGDTKNAAVRSTASKAKKDPRAVTVRIHGKNGRIQEERTYR